MEFLSFLAAHWFLTALAALVVILVVPSIRIIGPTEVGLVTKRFCARETPRRQPDRLPRRGRLPGRSADARLAFQVLGGLRRGEASRGCRFGPARSAWSWPRWASRCPSAPSRPSRSSELNLITDLRAWLKAGGQKGVQRPVLPPGSLMPVHPVGFLVITRERVYGVPVAHEFQRLQARGKLTYQSFGLSEEQLKVTVITPRIGGQRRRRSTPAASSPRSKASRCRAAPSPAASASSTTSRSWKARTPPIRRSSRP